DVLQFGDVLDQLLILIKDLLTLESREATQLEIEYGLGLNFTKFQAANDLTKVFEKSVFRFATGNSPPFFDFANRGEVRCQPGLGLINRARITDQRNDVIKRINRLVQAL